MRPVLCLVTDRARSGGEDRLVEIVGQAASAGVHLVQVREKDLEVKPLYELVRRLIDAVRGTTTRVLVNDRVDVAIAAGAHGVHLPATGVPAPRVRAVSPRGFLIGRSVHSGDEAARIARAGGVDYLVFGTVFGSDSKPGVRPAGLDALRAVTAAALPIPVLAIGGVTLERMGSIASAGAAGVAAIGLFADAARSGPERLQTIVRQAALSFDTPGGVP
jgi:thiamine-phosphate diphosphorylase